MLSLNLEKTLRDAYNLASTHKHEFVTLEHLLYALTDDKDALSVLNACGVDILKLKQQLEIFINEGETYNGVRLIGKKTCETLFENQLEGIENFEIGLAFGLASEEDYSKGGHGSVGTLSWGGYFNTSYFADPKENIIGIIYKQTQYIEDPTSKAFRELVFQSIID